MTLSTPADRRTAVFDLDGTLADTSADLLAAANATLAELGEAPPLGAPGDAAIALRGGRAMLRLGAARLGRDMDDAAIDRLYQRFLSHYARGLCRQTRLYPGAEAAVETLARAGWRIAVCTNKPVELAAALLKALGLDGRLHALVGAGTLDVIKPDPAPYRASVLRAGGQVARSFLVGDSITDHRTARAAGVPSVLVTFGPGGGDVAALEPDAVLDEFAQLPALAERLVP